MSRVRIIAAGMLVGLVATFAAVLPASAHDQLLSSSPSAGEVLAIAPATVSLDFSADVLTLGAAIVVADGDGRDWVAGDPVIQAGIVTVPLDQGMPEAGYELRWRVVSSDGHPIAGVIPFTIGAGAPLVRPDPTATPGVTTATTTQSAFPDGPLRLVLIGAAGAALAAGLFALTFLILRRRPRAAAPASRPEAGEPEKT